MDKRTNYLAFDLGAESGRAVIGRLGDGQLDLDVVHRFPNTPVRIPGGLHWDVLRLFHQMREGLRAAARDNALASVGLDTWGVDFALLDGGGNLLANPHHYRDSRTDGIMEEVFAAVPRAEVFRQTGIQFIKLNTLFQLVALKKQNPGLLNIAAKMIMIPDLFNYWFTGKAVCEFTEATTSQMYDPVNGSWAQDSLQRLDLPVHKLGEIVQPGTSLGPILAEVADDCGAGRIPLIAPATHDTGSAVAAVPAAGRDFLYISSGTWSLAGVEVRAPVITEASLASNFTNEGGVDGTFRLLKNIMGLWLVQECRRTWEKQGTSYDYTALTAMAAASAPFAHLVDPDDSSFLPPGDMPSRIQEFCRRTGQQVPETPGAIVRAALDSLALKYRWVAGVVEELTGRALPVIHIVGGGTQNKLLSQLTADASGREVIAGPVEATAIGNILVQAIGMGELASLADAREVVRASFELEHFTPAASSSGAVEDAYGRFVGLLAPVSA